MAYIFFTYFLFSLKLVVRVFLLAKDQESNTGGKG